VLAAAAAARPRAKQGSVNSTPTKRGGGYRRAPLRRRTLLRCGAPVEGSGRPAACWSEAGKVVSGNQCESSAVGDVRGGRPTTAAPSTATCSLMKAAAQKRLIRQQDAGAPGTSGCALSGSQRCERLKPRPALTCLQSQPWLACQIGRHRSERPDCAASYMVRRPHASASVCLQEYPNRWQSKDPTGWALYTYPAKRRPRRSRSVCCLRCPCDLAKVDGGPLSVDTSATLPAKRGSERAAYFPDGIEGYASR